MISGWTQYQLRVIIVEYAVKWIAASFELEIEIVHEWETK